MKPKSSDVRVRLSVDVAEALRGWMDANGHTSPTAATNAALRLFLKGCTTTPQPTVKPPRTTQPQSAESDSLLHSAFSSLLSE